MAQLITQTENWTLARRLSFRFLFLFFCLFFFFNPNGVIPYSDDAYNWYIQPFHKLIPWIGAHVLHLSYPITVFTNGSGDTTYDYVVIFSITVLAIAGCVLWTIIDRHRKSYPVLYYWLTVLVRYYLAITMLYYGFAKVFKTQFPFPYTTRLQESYGDSSPMGLAWTFFGYSRGYNYFMGLAEVVSGLLLFFRRTTPAGALLSFMVAGHIMVLNYCFDIPVKILSTSLVAMSLFLLFPNLKQLGGFFFRAQVTSLELIALPSIRRKWLRYSLRTFKYLLITYTLVMMTVDSRKVQRKYGDNAPKVPFDGIYNVKTMVKNRDTIPPLETDPLRWKQLTVTGFGTESYVQIKGVNDSLEWYKFQADTVRKMITITSYRDSTDAFRFGYQLADNGNMTLAGHRNNDSLRVELKQYPPGRFLLKSRGFHWINEYPFNR